MDCGRSFRTDRRENITDWSVQHYREHYNDKKITEWDIFYYVYGTLHHPGYRTKFADNLKRELPRIPLAPPLLSDDSAGISPAGAASLSRGRKPPVGSSTDRHAEPRSGDIRLGLCRPSGA